MPESVARVKGINQDVQIPFNTIDWLMDIHNPGLIGQFTGRFRRAGPHTMIEVRYPDGSLRTRPLQALKLMSKDNISIEGRLKSGFFGKIHDLKRLITYEKLKGTLHEVIYSMEAAQIDFYPYQFKPVLKFINSPTERLIIADEVGLGKTIESALIWIELQARKQARRLLVVCPRILTEKWRNELRSKFLLDARIVDFHELQQEIVELKNVGPTHDFVLIASYSGLRPPKKELKLLNEPPEETDEGTAKTKLLRELRHWGYPHPPFDLVIFDEAHYMRNAGTSTFHLGESISSHNDTGILCVSATPVNNSNTDLHSLLRLIDRDFFETQGMFDQLLDANRPSIKAINALARTPIDINALKEGVSGMSDSQFINKSPLFKQFLDILSQVENNPDNKPLLAKAQDMAEKLNLLGGYVNRTRRVQVEEGRPVRHTNVLLVEYTNEEMCLYQTILYLVRRKCRRALQAFHVFRVLSLQLRAASCLPVIAEDMRNGRFSNFGGSVDEMVELLSDGVGDDIFNNSEEHLEIDEVLDEVDFRALLDYDFESNDSKYKKLVELLDGTNDQKIIIFAYYRGTLYYLNRRLAERGINIAMIHGGVEHEQRWNELERFKNPRGPRVLLSSEVGSEGIDLQFCSTIINYDLPWNPMRVEQRIGRIDRVGQKAKVLSIVNFKVRNTVEERLYDRLHEKLLLFSTSLGDLESIIGIEVQKLTVELLRQELTPEQEIVLMKQTEKAIETKLLQIQKLEESGDTLVALSDYIQKKIREDRERGRFIQPEELEDYVSDFFEREFPGSEINYNTPADGCIRMRLSQEAQSSLASFMQNDRSLSATPLRQREFIISLRREAYERLSSNQRRCVTFVNHLSPLVRWVTQRNQDGVHTFYNVSALTLADEQLTPGTYIYLGQRCKFQGLMRRDLLTFAVMPLGGSEVFDSDQSEMVMQKVLRHGKDWDYPEFDQQSLMASFGMLRNVLNERFDSELEKYDAENRTTIQIRVQRTANHWDRLIQQSKKAIETMGLAGRKESLIRGRETRLKNEMEHKEQKIRQLEQGIEIDYEAEQISSGIFLVISEFH